MQSSRTQVETKEVRLEQGVVRYRESGEGPTIIFVHGILVNGALWRKVIPLLADRFRCIALDLPLGGIKFHSTRMRTSVRPGWRRSLRMSSRFWTSRMLRSSVTTPEARSAR